MRHESPKTFLNATPLEVAKTGKELKLPPDVVGEETQPYNISLNDQVVFLDPLKRKYAGYRHRGVQIDEVRGRVHLFQNTDSDYSLSISDSQLAEMEKAGRFFPKDSRLEWDQPDLSLTPEEKEEAERKLGYAVAVLDAARNRDVKITKKLIEETAALHAVEVGDRKPFCYNSVKKYLEIHTSGPFNPLAALKTRTSSGNRVRKYSDAFEALVQLCSYKAWEQPKGTWRTVKRLVIKQLERPENMHIALEVLDGDGLLIPADVTIQRRFYAVDRYTRALLRFGSNAAKRMFKNTTRRALPNAVLDEVEVDYTTVDVNVWADSEPLCYGRPKIILFRDRHSGVILGFAIFFGSPSLEHFLFGLKNAIYPKDMSRYPGFKWPYYGRPVVLVFDNDPHLLSDDVKRACDLLGIVARQCLPGEPNQKGAVERLIRTLNDYLFHNMPGATQSNPRRRKMFDKDKEMAVPKITLSGLEAFVVKWICAEYHVHSHVGLGPTRVMKGTPAERWKNSIVDVKMRPPLNPQTFDAIAGSSEMVTIQDGKVRLGHVTYEHPSLAVLATRPEHKAAISGVSTTEYRAVRTLGGVHRVTLVDHLDNDRAIELDVCPGDRAYAVGKRWFQHQAVVKRYNALMKREPSDTRDFQRFFDDHISELDQQHHKVASQKTAEALATFTSDLGKRQRLSRVVEIVESEAASATRIDYEDPFAPEPVAAPDAAPSDPPATPREVFEFTDDGTPVRTDPLAKTAPRRGRKPKAAPAAPRDDMDDDDIEFLLSKYEGYDE